MTTPDRCRARAEEAERLAEVVSYSRDKERLLTQAADWRRQAHEMEAGSMTAEPAATQAGLLPRARAWLDRRRRR